MIKEEQRETVKRSDERKEICFNLSMSVAKKVDLNNVRQVPYFNHNSFPHLCN